MLKDWDVMLALRACGRKNFGCGNRCRCHDVETGVSMMVKVARKLEFGPKRQASQRPPRDPKRRQARDKCENFETTVKFGIMNLVCKM